MEGLDSTARQLRIAFGAKRFTTTICRVFSLAAGDVALPSPAAGFDLTPVPLRATCYAWRRCAH
ncbi:hypothetical protein BN2497_335 [Janthinobacterium sp. CG23_2]|nr:hypothetical protein BN2497_335 [Janthinobacterium sp. CG23_2]CUU26565.1 hypothetical protein BN3177_335 [Janthinobacterium sp. CG23_2]